MEIKILVLLLMELSGDLGDILVCKFFLEWDKIIYLSIGSVG